MSYSEIVSYEWDFGDGDTSTDQNPIHEYDSSGVYHVTLTITNGDSDTYTQHHSIKVDAVEGEGYPDISSYEWDFGDGDTSTDQNPVHEYDSSGVYDITLTITNDDTESHVQYHSVKADAVDGEGYPAISSYSWDFGDGSTSTEQNPEHTYRTGTHPSITLTVENENAETAVQSTSLRIIGNSIQSAQWDFGEGKGIQSEELNPLHSFFPGLYDITLYIIDQFGGQAEITEIELIDVGMFVVSVSPESGRAPVKVQFGFEGLD